MGRESSNCHGAYDMPFESKIKMTLQAQKGYGRGSAEPERSVW